MKTTDYLTRKANDALQPIVDFCAENRGAMTEIQREFEKRTKQAWNRMNFSRWLHQVPDKRTEPLLGAGLVLIEIGNKVMEKHRQKAAKQPDE